MISDITRAWRRPLPLLLFALVLLPASLRGQERNVVELTLDRMVELTMANSFRIQQVNLGLQRTRYNLQAQQARLKSQVDLRLQAPSLQVQSDNQFDASLGRNVIVRENSQRWQADLSISQPVILFGYPTAISSTSTTTGTSSPMSTVCSSRTR